MASLVLSRDFGTACQVPFLETPYGCISNSNAVARRPQEGLWDAAGGGGGGRGTVPCHAGSNCLTLQHTLGTATQCRTLVREPTCSRLLNSGLSNAFNECCSSVPEAAALTLDWLCSLVEAGVSMCVCV